MTFSSVFKFLLKGLLFIVGLMIVGFISLKLIYNEPIPNGETGQKADELAQKVLQHLDYKAYKSTKAIQWTFMGKNRYEWNLQDDQVMVFWDDYKVIYTTKAPEKSRAYKNSIEIEGHEKEKAVAYAIKNFNNDSFWVIAPFKINDPGTIRKLVEVDGKQKLLVQYTTGGTTPGDAYLWEFDDNYKPIAFKMWVSIIPFDGIEVNWDNWQKTDAGFLLSKKKSIFGLDIPVTRISVIP